jgi:hypothetical protein
MSTLLRRTDNLEGFVVDRRRYGSSTMPVYRALRPTHVPRWGRPRVARPCARKCTPDMRAPSGRAARPGVPARRPRIHRVRRHLF